MNGGTMKKFLVLVFILGFGGAVFAQVHLSIPVGVFASTGDTVRIPINVDNLTGMGVAGYELDFSFDPAVLRPIGYDTTGTRTTTVSSSSFIMIVDGSDSISIGKYYIVMAGTDTLVGSGTLITIKCVVLGGSNSYSTLRVSRIKFGDGEPVGVTTDGFFGLPFQPALVSPANGASGLSTSPTLSWHSAEGAVSYHLQVSANAGFTALVVNDSTLTDTTKALPALPDSAIYHWRVCSKNYAGSSAYSPIWLFALSITNGINRLGDGIPSSFDLGQNYPNPFNPTTNIEFRVAKQSFVTLAVYDMLGHKVATLVNEVKSPGSYRVTMDGSTLSSGTYFYTMKTGTFTMSKKFILMK